MRKRASSPEGAGDAGAASGALTRGLQIMRSFTPEDTTLGNQDLIDRTGLPRATVSRLTLTLTSLGYLYYDERLGRYSIGPAAISLGYSALSSNVVAHTARPLMRELADKTGAAVALGTRDGTELVYLANCRAMNPASLQLNVGSRVPIERTAMGLAYLADMEPDERAALVDQVVRNRPTEEVSIRSLVAEATTNFQKYGFVPSFGRWFSYINAVGVAFRPADGTPPIAITCGGIVDILPPALCLEKIGPELVALIQRLNAILRGER